MILQTSSQTCSTGKHASLESSSESHRHDQIFNQFYVRGGKENEEAKENVP